MSENWQRFRAVAKQLVISQRHVEIALEKADRATDEWEKASTDPDAYSRVLNAIDALRDSVEQHFTRVAGEGLIEEAVAQSPELYPRLQEIELWQSRLADRAIDLSKRIRAGMNDPDLPREIVAALGEFRRELFREELEERSLIDLGLHD